MSKPITCQECGKEKKRNLFSAAVRMGCDDPICNQCKYKYPMSKSGKALTTGAKKSEMKMLPCLGKCGKSFLTVPSIRFCGPCKPKGDHDNYTILTGGE